MRIDTFLLERNQSEHENSVELNLTESGVHPQTIRQLLAPDDLDAFLSLPINYGHTEGMPALREAIASWYPAATADNVLVTTGASEANFITAWTLLETGDRFGFMTPNFMQLDGAARAFGAEPFHLPLRPELGWRLDFDEVGRLLADGARLVSIVNPHNPTGKVMALDDMRRLVDLVEAAGAWLHVDEIYRGAEIGTRPETPSFWGLSDRIVVTASTSKSIAHAGLRLGWLVAPPAFVYECMRRQDYTTIGTSPLCQFLGERLLRPESRQGVLDRSRAILTGNLSAFDDWARAADLGLDHVTPEAGGMIFLRYPQPINSTELSRRLRETESVFIVAGDCFGLDGHLRVGIGGERKQLQEGLARFGRFLRRINGRT
jgi:hypothetical protein